jgi:hypothetical protein
LTEWLDSGRVRPNTLDGGMSLTCMNIGGRARYRTADRWCVKLHRTVYGISHGAHNVLKRQVSR